MLKKILIRGLFVRYSVGWKAIDDGGQLALEKSTGREPRQDLRHGDWPWPVYPGGGQ